MKTTTLIIITLAIATALHSQVIHVPADYATIQQGINAASNGDTVLVADSTYYENINFNGKAILVASKFIMDGDTSHISNTVINGSQPDDPDFGSVVIFRSGEDTTSVLCGFTITGGTGTIEPSINYRMGGGVNISFSGAKLLYNHIQNNSVIHDHGVYGGGIQAGGPIGEIPWIVMRHNRISNNTALSIGYEGSGGGVVIFYNIIMVENEISNNTVNAPWKCSGGGVEIGGAFDTIELNVRNNIIRNNKAISEGDLSEYTITGGLCLAFRLTGIVSGNDISYNEIESADGTWGQGAGVLVQEAITDEFVFENNFITNNTHLGESCLGGGMLLCKTGGKFQNNIVRNNQGTHGGGIAIQDCTEEWPVLINNNITGNTAANAGGGLYLENASVDIINSIIWGNSAPSDASIFTDGNTLEVMYSDVEGEYIWPGEENINEDPGFLDESCHLDENSPCEDKGTAYIFIGQNLYEAPEYDIEWTIRPYHMGIDIGATECDIITKVPEQSAVGSQRLAVSSYPNPFSSFTTFEFELEHSARINLTIYNHLGQQQAVLADREQAAGKHQVHWDAEGLPAGIYYYRLTTDDYRLTTGKIVKY